MAVLGRYANGAQTPTSRGSQRRVRVAALLAAVLCGAVPPAGRATGAGAPSAAQAAFDQLGALRKQADALKSPLAAYALYRDRYEHASAALQPMLAQLLAATESELGAYDAAVAQFPFGVTKLSEAPAPLPSADDYRAQPAADAITALAAARRVVMINEAHHVAQTRALTLALLPRLRAAGFTHFAAEGLDEHDVELNKRGYPVASSGTYVREPLYGEIVRTALRLGFVVVPYESAESDAPARERGQAQHLFERVLHNDPAARLFVHAGYAHVHKHAGYLFDADPMALHLQRMTGLDVLSIDQTMLRPDARGGEYADYRVLLERFAIHAPSVLRGARDGAPWSLQPAYYDVSVILPPTTHAIVGRPDWLALDGARTPVAIDLDLSERHLPCVLEARYAGESDKAVPADRVLIERTQGQAVLFLRPGSYRISAADSAAHAIFVRRLDVDAAATP